MIRQHPLVRHPVGRLPALARWYLAGIAMLSLLLVAIHFAMQVYAQQEANRLVQQWSDRFGVSVADVRYRMLRGALTLVDVRYQGNGLRLYAPSIFLHGNLTALSGQNPKASYVEVRDADISMSSATFDDVMERKHDVVPELFGQLWRSAQRVGIYETRVRILPAISESFPAKPIEGVLTRFDSSDVGGVREIKALASWQEGEVMLTARNQLVEGISRFTQGVLRWRGLNAAILLRDLLGFDPVPGTAYGSVTWGRKDETSHAYDLRGAINISATEGQRAEASIGWRGTVTDGAWQVTANSVAWPLNVFSSHLPGFQGQRVKAGQFDGGFRLAGILDRWQMDVAESTVSDIYLDGDETNQSEVSGWRSAKVVLKNGTLQWPKRSIVVEQIELNDADAVIDARAMKPEEAEWEISLNQIFFDDLRATVQLSEERLLLPVLDGEAQWKSQEQISIKLKSSDSSGEENGEQWRIRGSGNPSSTGRDRLQFDVRANNTSLARFRPLLPEMIRNEATDLVGEIALKLNLDAGAGPWQGSGEISVSRAGFQYGGEQWQFDRADVEIGRIGVSDPIQEISRIEVDGWHYQPALRPLQRPGMNGELQDGVQSDVEVNIPDKAEGGKQDEVVAEAAVEKKESKAEAWEIKKLVLNDGTVAVGQIDAPWMSGISIQAEGVRPGKKIPVELRATSGGGSVAVKGSLRWTEAMPALQDAKIMVRDVIPFFMNEWFSISHLPQMIRGRLYADITVKVDEDQKHSGVGYFRLQHGLLSSAVVEDDLLLSHVGFNAFDVFNTLQRSDRLRIRVPIEGSGEFADVLGDSMVQSIKRDMSSRRIGHPVDVVPGDLLTSIRLHAEKSLSQNERVRLRKVVKHMLANPKVSIELRPQLSLSMDGEDQVKRVLKTQKLIESFLVQRGVSSSRVFPIWPHEQLKRSGSSSGIGVHELR